MTANLGKNITFFYLVMTPVKSQSKIKQFPVVNARNGKKEVVNARSGTKEINLNIKGQIKSSCKNQVKKLVLCLDLHHH